MQVRSLIQTATNNAVKCSGAPAESPAHRNVKWLLASYCWDNNLDFSTEVVWRDGSRADFVIHDWKLCIEVLGSESLKCFAKKKYPVQTLPIKTGVEPEQVIAMLKDIANLEGDAGYYIQKAREQ